MNWDLISFLKQLIDENDLAISSEEINQAFTQTHHQSEPRLIYRLIGKIINTSHTPSIGLKAGKLINPNSFHGLGYLFMTAESLHAACQRISEFPAFYSNLVRLSVYRDEQQMYICAENQATNTLTRAVINEGALGIIYQYTNWLSREIINDCRIELTHSPINSEDVYQSYFHRQPQFHSDANRLIFPNHIALAPLITSEADYHALLYSKLREKHQAMTKSFLARASSAIRKSISTGRVNKRQVARQLNLSEKTLERRLARLNMSYRELIEIIREDMAKKYLHETQYSIDKIATCLGYADRSSFAKAYKKWTGLTPASSRQISHKRKHEEH